MEPGTIGIRPASAAIGPLVKKLFVLAELPELESVVVHGSRDLVRDTEVLPPSVRPTWM
ncbi:hypothetical protein ACWGIU_14200 [Streptomyces sp. NPDC054840]